MVEEGINDMEPVISPITSPFKSMTAPPKPHYNICVVNIRKQHV